MIVLKSGFVPEEGETPILELEAELWALSSNPIARAIGAVMRFIAMILGCRRSGFVVLTDRRIVEISNNTVCYCFVGNRTIKNILLSSVKEVGYTREATCGCFCPAYHLYYQAFTQNTSILLKGANEDQTRAMVSTFYNVISQANKKSKSV